jgi:acyl dehydratase
MKGGGAEAAATDWPQAGSEIPPRSFGPFDRDWLARYAMVSGDDNPLHLDPNAAREAGLPGVPVHGMLMFSCFEPFIMGWRPDCFIARLSGKFLRPVLAGEGIRIFGRVVRRRDVPRAELVLRLIARAPNDDLAILAEATVLPKRADHLR